MIDPTAPAPRTVGAVNFAGHASLAGVHALFGHKVDLPGGGTRFANAPVPRCAMTSAPKRLRRWGERGRSGCSPGTGGQSPSSSNVVISSGASEHTYDPALVSMRDLRWADTTDAVTMTTRAT
jgi:hypothetical protein